VTRTNTVSLPAVAPGTYWLILKADRRRLLRLFDLRGRRNEQHPGRADGVHRAGPGTGVGNVEWYAVANQSLSVVTVVSNAAMGR